MEKKPESTAAFLREFGQRPELADQVTHCMEQYKKVFSPLEALAFFSIVLVAIIENQTSDAPATKQRELKEAARAFVGHVIDRLLDE